MIIIIGIIIINIITSIIVVLLLLMLLFIDTWTDSARRESFGKFLTLGCCQLKN